MDFGLEMKKDLSSEPSEINLQVSYSISDNSAFIFNSLWKNLKNIKKSIKIKKSMKLMNF